jgi:hypothetical protein
LKKIHPVHVRIIEDETSVLSAADAAAADEKLAEAAQSSALDGDTGPPGEVAGFGLVDHHDTRDLAPRTRPRRRA